MQFYYIIYVINFERMSESLDGFNIISHKIILLATAILIGAVTVKTGYISKDIKNMLSKVIVKITLPLLILNSLTQVELDSARIKNSVFIVLSAIAIIAVMYLLGTLISKIFKLPKKTAFMHRCMTAFGNVAFLGYPIIYELYGADGLFYAALYTLVNDIFVWTFVVWRLTVMNGTEKKSTFETLKNCLNPPTVAFAISFILMISGIRPSGIVKEIAEGIGGTTTYLSMLFIGGTLAETKFSNILKSYPLIFVVLVKMVLIPTILIYVMRHIPIEPLVKGTLIMQVAVPTQTILSILTKEFGGDTDYVVKGIFITTVSGLVTMPFIYYLLTTL